MAEPDPSPPAPLSPLGEAAEGFVELAHWFSSLVGEQAVQLARALDSGAVDAKTLTVSVARAATTPLLGTAALVNEVLDAASILTSPFERERRIRSPVFHAPGVGHARTVTLRLPLRNGFGDPFPTPSAPGSGPTGPAPGAPGAPGVPVPVRPSGLEETVVVGTPSSGRQERPPQQVPAGLVLAPAQVEFQLHAPVVAPTRVGVYRGTAIVRFDQPGPGARLPDLSTDVWLVVP